VSLTPYPRYKPSGVEWLGEVPEHWEVKRLKVAVELTDKKVEADEENPVPYVGLENIESWTGRLLPLDPDLIPSGTANEFKAGNTLFGKLRPYLAKACNPDFSGLCSTELLVLECRGINRRALLYLLLSDGFINLVDSSTYGSKMPRANWGFIGDCRVPIATPDEQRAIADFLDRETAKIDKLVARKRTLVERLKEKRTALIARTVTRGLPPDAASRTGLDPHPKLRPSGIDWLGEVPEHWEVLRLKLVSQRITKGTTPTTLGHEFVHEGVTFVKVESIANDLRVLPDQCAFIENETHALLGRSQLQEGDVLVGIAGAIGRIGIVERQLLPANTNQAVGIVRLGGRALPRWIAYCLSADMAQEQFGVGQVQSAQANLSLGNLANTWIPMPSAGEQGALVDFLDWETTKLDTMVTKVEAAIDRLLEYRTALITAAVTGKVDVRGASA
jgi:type I restriction enzyme, S subunit